MLNQSFSPFFRSTVGFDHLFDLLDELTAANHNAALPPYNIERSGDDRYLLTFAVAGYSAEELSVEIEDRELIVRGNKKDENDRSYLHRGLPLGSFEHRLHLADYIEIDHAELRDGLLRIQLVRNVPEALKPRRIPIGGGAAASLASKAKKLLGGVGKAA